MIHGLFFIVFLFLFFYNYKITQSFIHANVHIETHTHKVCWYRHVYFSFCLFVAVRALVEHEYQAKEPDELNLVKFDQIYNVKIQPGGWWEGTLASNGKTGMFPDNFVRLFDSDDKNAVVLR